MAYPTFVGVSTFASGTGALSVAAVAGVQSGDVILMGISSDPVSDGNTYTPSGYTQLRNVIVGTNRIAVYSRVATGADTTTSVADHGSYTAAFKIAYRNVFNPTALQHTFAFYGTSATSHSAYPGALTPPKEVCTYLVFLGLDRDASSTNAVNSVLDNTMTEFVERADQITNAGSGGGVWIGSREYTGATIPPVPYLVQLPTADNITLVLVALPELASEVALQASRTCTVSVSAALDVQRLEGSASCSVVAVGAISIAIDETVFALRATFTGVNEAVVENVPGGGIFGVALNSSNTNLIEIPEDWYLYERGSLSGGKSAAIVYSNGFPTAASSGTFTNATSVSFAVYSAADTLVATPMIVQGSLPTASVPSVSSDYASASMVACFAHASGSLTMDSWGPMHPHVSASYLMNISDFLVSNDLTSAATNGAGTWVVTGDSKIWVSTNDMGSWSQVSGTSAVWYAWYVEGAFRLVRNNTSLTRSSTDGVTWSAEQSTGVSASSRPGLFYFGGRFIVPSTNNICISTTSDFTGTYTRDSTYNGSWENSAQSASLAVVIGDGPGYIRFTSGTTYAQHDFPSPVSFTYFVRDIVYNGTQFVAFVADPAKTILGSTDALTWSVIGSYPNISPMDGPEYRGSAFRVAYLGGRYFVSVSIYSGHILTSTDLSNWEVIAAPGPRVWFRPMLSGGNELVWVSAVGPSGAVLKVGRLAYPLPAPIPVAVLDHVNSGPTLAAGITGFYSAQNALPGSE